MFSTLKVSLKSEIASSVEVIFVLNKYPKDVLSGKVIGKENTGNNFGLPLVVNDYGVRINYGEKSLK